MNKNKKLLLIVGFLGLIGFFLSTDLKADENKVILYDDFSVEIASNEKEVILNYSLDDYAKGSVNLVENNDLIEQINQNGIQTYEVEIGENKIDLVQTDVNNFSMDFDQESIMTIHIESKNTLSHEQIIQLVEEQFIIHEDFVPSLFNFSISSEKNGILARNQIEPYAGTMAYQCIQGGIIYSESNDEFQEINLLTGDVEVNEEVTKALNEHGSSKINALGYNPNDSLIYGIDNTNKELIVIGADGVSFFPLINAPKANIEGGTIDTVGNTLVVVYPSSGRNAYGYISLDHSDIGTFYPVTDTDGRSVKFVGDLFYSEDLDDFFGIEISSTNIMRANLDRSIPQISSEIVQQTAFNANVSGIFGNFNDVIYVYDTSGRVYGYVIDTREVFLVANTTSAGGDATYCADSFGIDFGDAPDSYKTQAISDGPRHAVMDDFTYLGEDITTENSANIPLDFTGDANDDGFSTINSGLIDEPLNNENNIEITASRAGFVSLWADIDNNGSFDPQSEIIIDTQQVTAGDNYFNLGNINFVDTMSAVPIRVRYIATDDQQLAQSDIGFPTGAAANGEVEDYVVPIIEPAVLSAEKIVSDSITGNNNGTAEQGEQLQYSISITNTSVDSIATGVELIDTIPATLELFTLTDVKVTDVVNGPNLIGPGNGITVSQQGNQLILEIAELAPGETLNLEYKIQVKSDLTGGQTITNTATLADSYQSYDDISASIEVVGDAEYIVTKQNIDNADGLVESGEELFYEITIENRGIFTINNAIITDDLSDANFDSNSFTFISLIDSNGDAVPTSAYTVDEGTNTVTINTIFPGEMYTLKFSALVDDPLVDTNVISLSNQAQVCSDLDTSGSIDENECKKSNTVFLEFAQSLTIEKKNINNSDNFVSKGETLEYQITLTNTSDIQLKNVVAYDNFTDVNLNGNSFDLTEVRDNQGNLLVEGNDYIVDLNNNIVTINQINPLEKVDIYLTVDVFSVLENSNVSNVTNQASTCILNNCFSSNEVAIPFDRSVSVLKENINNDNLTTEQGERLEYSITINNTSDVYINELTVTDLFDDVNFEQQNFIVESVTDSQSNQISYTEDLANNKIIINDIPNGEEITVVISQTIVGSLVDVQAGGVNNTATICISDNSLCEDTNEVFVPFMIDFNISKANVNNDDNFVSAGETLYYNITIENTSSIDISNVMIADLLTDPNFISANVDLMSITDKNNNPISLGIYTYDQETATALIDEIPFGETYTLHFSITVPDPLIDTNVTSVKNSAKATVGDVEKKSNEVVIPFEDKFTIDKTNIDNPDEVASIDEVLQYQIVFTNSGDVALNNVRINDPFTDQNFDQSSVQILEVFDSAQNDLVKDVDYSLEESINTLTLNKVDADESITIIFSIKILNTLVNPNATTVNNVASACYPTAELCQDSEEIIIPLDPEIGITKANINNIDDYSSAGEKLYYQISVTNFGNSNLKDVVVKDNLTDDNIDPTTFEVLNVIDGNEQALIPGTDYSVDGDQITITTVNANQTYKINVAVNVRSTLVNTKVEEIINTATVTYQSESITSSEVKVPFEKKVAIEKQNVDNEDELVEAGEFLKYEILVTNTSDIDLNNVTVTDPFSDNNLNEFTTIIVSILDSNGQNVTEYTVNDLENSVTFTSIAANESYALTFGVDVKLSDFDNNASTINNQAQVCIEDEDLCLDSEVVAIPIKSDLNIIKRNVNNLDGLANKGELLSYDLVITNNSINTQNNIIVQEIISDVNLDPNSFVINSVLSSNGPLTEGINYSNNLDEKTVTINAIDPNEIITINISVSVLDPMIDSTQNEIINTARVCDEVNNCKTSPEEKVSLEEKVSISKENINNDDQTATAGETLVYEVTLENIGSSDVEFVEVKDFLADINLDAQSIKLISVVDNLGNTLNPEMYIIGANSITFNELKTDGFVTITFTAKAYAPLVDRSQFELKNKASYCYNEICEESNEVVIPFDQKLAISKANVNNPDSKADLGEVLEYEITLENNGSNDIYNIAVNDNLTDPNLINDSLELVSVLNSNGEAVDYVVNGQVLYFDLIPANEIYTIKLKVKVSDILLDSSLNSISNIASVCPTGVQRIDQCKNSNEVEVPFNESYVVQKVNVENDDGQVNSGEKLYYEISVTNTSNFTFLDTKIIDNFDDSNFNSESAEVISLKNTGDVELVKDKDYTVDESTNSVTIKELPANETYTLRLSVEILEQLVNEDVDTISNQASICHDDCLETNEVVIPFEKSYEITKENVENDDGNASAGETLSYSIQVENNSSVSLDNVTIYDNFNDVNLNKDTINLVSITDSNGKIVNSSTYDLEENSVTFTSIAAKESYCILFTVDVLEVLADTKQENINNIAIGCVGELCIETDVVKVPFESKFSIEKENVNNPDEVASKGEVLYYDITITNEGDSTLSNVIVNDPLNDVNFNKSTIKLLATVNSQGDAVTNYTVDNQTITFAEVQPGEEYTISFSVELLETLVDDSLQMISNNATICIDDKCEEATEELPLNPEILVVKNNINNDDGMVDSGERLTYELNVKNNGLKLANNVTVSDNFSDENFNEKTINIDGIYDETGNSVPTTEYIIDEGTKSIILNQLEVEETIKIIVSITVDEILDNPNVTKISNTATACTQTNDCMTTVPEDIEYTSSFAITKDIINNEDEMTEAGERLFYEFTLTNNGATNLVDFSFFDEFSDENFFKSSIELVSMTTSSGEEITNYSWNPFGAELIFDLPTNEEVKILISIETLNLLQNRDASDISNIASASYEENIVKSNTVNVPFYREYEISKENINNEDGYASPNETLYYQIALKNTTGLNLNSLVVNDLFTDYNFDQQSLKLVSIVDQNANEVSDFEINEELTSIILEKLRANETVYITYAIDVLDDFADKSQSGVYNTAESCLETLCQESNETYVPFINTFTISKLNVNNEDNTAMNNEVLQYNITVQNTSQIDLMNVSVTDLLLDEAFIKDSVELIEITSNNGSKVNYKTIDNGIMFNMMEAGVDYIISFNVTLNDFLLNDEIINTAIICNEEQVFCEEGQSIITIDDEIIPTDPNVTDPNVTEPDVTDPDVTDPQTPDIEIEEKSIENPLDSGTLIILVFLGIIILIIILIFIKKMINKK